MNRTLRRGLAMITAAGLAVGLAACGGGARELPSGNEPVTITIGDYPSTKAAAARAVYEKNLAAFKAENPNVTVKAVETKWDAQTFQAMVAGGTMPTVMAVPFTDTRLLIENGQVAEITDIAEQVGLTGQLNPTTLEQARNAEDKLFGVPTSVDAMSLVYNRKLFTDAGLDPDQPPTTWAEVRTAAKTIAEKTKAAGFIPLTKEGMGGWAFTTQLYSNGGRVQDDAGKEVTLGSPQTTEALKALQTMRFEDKSMGDAVLWDIDSVLRDFAVDKIGMTVVPPGAYEWISTSYEIDVKRIGVGGLPQADGGPHGNLLMGSVQMFNAKATPAELQAALKWVDKQYLAKYRDEATAVADAKAKSKDGGIVGIPGLSPLSPEAYTQYRKWIEPEINVDPKQFAGFTASLATVPLVPEPATRAQEVYPVLGALVQKALGSNDVDLDKAVVDASGQIERIIGQ